jgi:hypothetical protein
MRVGQRAADAVTGTRYFIVSEMLRDRAEELLRNGRGDQELCKVKLLRSELETSAAPGVRFCSGQNDTEMFVFGRLIVAKPTRRCLAVLESNSPDRS